MRSPVVSSGVVSTSPSVDKGPSSPCQGTAGLFRCPQTNLYLQTDGIMPDLQFMCRLFELDKGFPMNGKELLNI